MCLSVLDRHLVSYMCVCLSVLDRHLVSYMCVCVSVCLYWTDIWLDTGVCVSVCLSVIERHLVRYVCVCLSILILYVPLYTALTTCTSIRILCSMVHQVLPGFGKSIWLPNLVMNIYCTVASLECPHKQCLGTCVLCQSLCVYLLCT